MPRSLAPTGFAPPRARRPGGTDRLPAGIALPIILALSAIAWLGLVWAAAALRALLPG
jgi:hypothetical protein